MCVCMRAHIQTRVCMCECVHAYVHACMHACACGSVHVSLRFASITMFIHVFYATDFCAGIDALPVVR